MYLNLSLALSGLLMRHFGTVVRIAVRAVGYRWHHPSARGRITPQLIGAQAAGDHVLYNVAPRDTGRFLAVVWPACSVPARRAARVDPAVTLRAD